MAQWGPIFQLPVQSSCLLRGAPARGWGTTACPHGLREASASPWGALPDHLFFTGSTPPKAQLEPGQGAGLCPALPLGPQLSSQITVRNEPCDCAVGGRTAVALCLPTATHCPGQEPSTRCPTALKWEVTLSTHWCPCEASQGAQSSGAALHAAPRGKLRLEGQQSPLGSQLLCSLEACLAPSILPLGPTGHLPVFRHTHLQATGPLHSLPGLLPAHSFQACPQRGLPTH